MIPFSPPRIDDKIVDEVAKALRSGWITTGPRTKELEKQLTAYCGNRRTLCVNSATAGLELILRWFGVKEGDEVIVPAYTYCATANVVMHCGAKPVLVDVADDFNITVEHIKKAITSKTKVIMPVDIAGFPCDYEEINALVNTTEVKKMFHPNTLEQEQLGRILVLADAAHSVGAHYNSKRAGSFTDVSVFSFHAVKNLTTAEGGGIMLNLPEPFDCDEVYKVLNIKSLHGQTKDALAKTKNVGGWRYDIIEAGYKCNMTDLQAAIGLVELERYEETLAKRKLIFQWYEEGFLDCDWAKMPTYKVANKESAYHIFQLRIEGISEQQRDAIIQDIFDREVSVNVHFQPLPLLSFYKNLGYNIEDYPTAFDLYSREITLPCYYNLTKENVDFIVKAVKEAYTSVCK